MSHDLRLPGSVALLDPNQKLNYPEDSWQPSPNWASLEQSWSFLLLSENLVCKQLTLSHFGEGT